MRQKVYQVVLNEEKTSQLDLIAKSEERSRSFMIRLAIEEFLENKGVKNAAAI
jgi:predicted transcriptional regulator